MLIGSLKALAVALTALASTAAAGARTIVIGHSVKGRPIIALVRGPNDAPRKILVVGCIHGNECAGLAIVSALERAPVVKGVQLWLVPEMNPDGTAADTRQNADGVDLNRNFPYQWAPVSDPTYYSGPRPLSEPETRAAVRLIRRIRPAVTIWYHQHMDLVDMAGGDRGVARRYAQLAPAVISGLVQVGKAPRDRPAGAHAGPARPRPRVTSPRTSAGRPRPAGASATLRDVAGDLRRRPRPAGAAHDPGGAARATAPPPSPTQAASGSGIDAGAGAVSSYAASSNRRVCCQKRHVKSGQIVLLRPLRSMYQLAQPPVFQTVPPRRSWTCSL